MQVTNKKNMPVINKKPCVSDLKMQAFAQKILVIDQERCKLSTRKNSNHQQKNIPVMESKNGSY